MKAESCSTGANIIVPHFTIAPCNKKVTAESRLRRVAAESQPKSSVDAGHAKWQVLLQAAKSYVSQART